MYAISIALPRSVVKYHLIVAAMVSPLSALWLNWKIKHTNEYISDSDAQIIENLQLDLINETSSDRQLFNY